MKSDKDDDATAGYVRIVDGTLALTAGDEGIDATTDLIVEGGTLTVGAGGGTGRPPRRRRPRG
nr:carbohydrate-binding domain-containing protein [Tessaracoccus coleopterorum]